MNYRYTGLLLVALAGSAFGQRVSQKPTRSFAKPERWVNHGLPLKPTGQEKSAGDVVFGDDFANGLAGNNNVGAWTAEGVNGSVWAYDTDGPNGDFSTTAERIQSTTVNNGFMIFDSNLFNNGCTDCVGLDGYLVSPALDLSTTPYVHLYFEQRVRWCCNTFPVQFVDVSTDGGASWPTRLDVVRNTQFVNDDPGTYSCYLNLKDAISANPANVKFRFAHESSSGTGQVTSHYYWQVDDVKVLESQANDVDMKNPAFNAYNPLTDLTDKAEFNIYPLDQTHEFMMGSPVTNEGSNPAIDVTMNVAVTEPGGGTTNLSASEAIIQPAALDSNLFVGYTPSEVGDYSVALNTTMDSTDTRPENNTATRTFQVSQYVYAQDENARDGFIDNVTDGVAGEYLSCNFFWIENTADLTAFQVALAGSGNTNVGGEFDCTVLDGNFDELGTTITYTVTANGQLSGNGQAKFQTVMFDSPLTIDGGQEVCACLHFYGGTPKVAVASSGASLRGTSMFMRANDDQNRFLELASPMVRLNFDPNVGIEEADRQNGVGLGQNFPNPSKGSTTIPYDLKTTAAVTLEVYELSGKRVITRSEGTKAPGAYRLDIATSDLNEGVYFYTLQAGGTRLTKRMTVLH